MKFVSLQAEFNSVYLMLKDIGNKTFRFSYIKVFHLNIQKYSHLRNNLNTVF